MLDQTLQQMLPNLTAAAKAELNLRLAELWDYNPVVVRYRKGKRLVLGFYWLKSGDLRCISIRPNEIRIERYDSEKDKLYYRRGVNLSNDKCPMGFIRTCECDGVVSTDISASVSCGCQMAHVNSGK